MHPHAVHHVWVRNVTLRRWKLSSQQAVLCGGGLCSSLIILHTLSATAQEPRRLLGEEGGLGPYSWRSKRRLRISAAQCSGGQDATGPRWSYGACGSTWTHAYQKAGALVSRSRHRQPKQSMNEYEETFMNILLSVIVFFKPSFSQFYFPLLPALQIFSLPLWSSIWSLTFYLLSSLSVFLTCCCVS